MRAHLHIQASEKALEGAKELLKQADAQGADAITRGRFLDSAHSLIGIAGVHANLAQAMQLSHLVGQRQEP